MKNFTQINARKNGTGKLFGGVFASSLLAIALCTSCTRRDTVYEERQTDTVVERTTAADSTTLDSSSSSASVSGTTTGVNPDTDASASTSGSVSDTSTSSSESTSRSYGSAYDQGPAGSPSTSGTDTTTTEGVNTQSTSGDSTMGNGSGN